MSLSYYLIGVIRQAEARVAELEAEVAGVLSAYGNEAIARERVEAKRERDAAITRAEKAEARVAELEGQAAIDDGALGHAKAAIDAQCPEGGLLAFEDGRREGIEEAISVLNAVAEEWAAWAGHMDTESLEFGIEKVWALVDDPKGPK